MRFLLTGLIVSFLSTFSLLGSDPLLERSSLSTFEKLISEEEIAESVAYAAKEVQDDLEEEGITEVTFVALMKGAICFASDFMRAFEMPSTLECVRTCSYGQGGKERGELTIIGFDKLEIEGKHIVVVDDIYDSGVTMASVVKKIKEKHPKSVHSVVFLHKNVKHAVDYVPDYTVFDIEDRFVIGYGMDYKEYWRDLPAVYAVD